MVDVFGAIFQEICDDSMNADMQAKGYMPVYTASAKAKIVIVGQAPGRKAQESLQPWSDVSGKLLRSWLGVTDEQFYDPNVVALGQSLYLNGDPAKGIPACQGCHGKDAQGFPDAMTPNRNGHVPYALFPKLRGQQLDYLQTRLGQYQTGEAMDSSADRIMNGVGHRLDAESIAALSQYLSSQ